MNASGERRFDTLTGVFLPTLLSIFGVIMYVRIGWVVGNAGLLGALLVLGLAVGISAATGLSLASIATNTRIGHGGPFAILERSLGIEVAGSIGIPLYLTRPMSAAIYVFGFREGVVWLLPSAPTLLVDLAIFGALFGLAYAGAAVAFRAQYVVLALIAASLVSVFASSAPAAYTGPVVWWGSFRGTAETGFAGTDLWGVFAVFFPAVTGIFAGANMSGELVNPRRSIPVGTLSAIAVSSVVYTALILWVAQTGSLDQLTESTTWMIDHAWSPPVVVAGLLGATASAALSNLISGPRILAAMSRSKLVPFSDALGRTEAGEPRNAILVTGALTVGCILVRDLNVLAPLLTMFFLITYGMINLVVLFEDALGLVSYRPTLRVPRWIPGLGLLGCVVAMAVVNPLFALIAVATVVGIYVSLHRRGLAVAGETDAQSTIFVALAEWAASRVAAEDLRNARAWKPHVVVPVRDPAELDAVLPVVGNLVAPEGSIRLLGVATDGADAAALRAALERRAQVIHRSGQLASASTVSGPDPWTAVGTGVEALQGTFFRPNLLFLRLDDPGLTHDRLLELLAIGAQTGVGLLVYRPGGLPGLGQRRRVRMFVRGAPQAGWSVDAAFDQGSLDLVLLLGYRVHRFWRGELSLVTVVAEADQVAAAAAFQRELCDLARLPEQVSCLVQVGELAEVADRLPPADLSVFGLGAAPPTAEWLASMARISAGACLFVRDSGLESARA